MVNLMKFVLKVPGARDCSTSDLLELDPCQSSLASNLLQMEMEMSFDCITQLMKSGKDELKPICLCSMFGVVICLKMKPQNQESQNRVGRPNSMERPSQLGASTEAATWLTMSTFAVAFPVNMLPQGNEF